MGYFLGCTAHVISGFYINMYSTYSNAIHPILKANNNSNNIAVDIFAAIRLSKKVNKKLELFAAPSIRYGLSLVQIKGNMQPQKINQTSLAIGMAFLLNNK